MYNHVYIVIMHAGEINPEEHVPNDDREKYYLLWKELGVANQLTEYSANNTSSESIVFGTHIHSDTLT